MDQGQDLEKEIEKRLAELPEAVRESILSNDVGGHVRVIATNHKLHIDQMATLEDQVFLVMLGFTKNEEFVGNLEKALSLPKNEAETLVAEINTEIFLPIRQLMQEEKAASPQVAMPSAVAAPKPVAPAPPPPPAIAPKPVAPPNFVPADMMLSQKTVTKMPAAPLTPPQQVPPPAPKPPAPSVVSPAPVAPTPAPAVPPKPPEYKADPYREPPL